MSPNEPKPPRVTRTLPAIDVVVESDPPPSSRSAQTERSPRTERRPNVPFQVSVSDIEALRRVRRPSDSDAPAPRPSLPVRAARNAKDKSPWIVVGMLVVELARYALEHLL